MYVKQDSLYSRVYCGLPRWYGMLLYDKTLGFNLTRALTARLLRAFDSTRLCPPGPLRLFRNPPIVYYCNDATRRALTIADVSISYCSHTSNSTYLPVVYSKSI